MSWSAIAHSITADWLEILATFTTLFGIWLTTRRSMLCWPIVLAADCLYLVVFFRAGLFSDALLQGAFVVFTFYGWWHWWRGVRDEGEVRVVPLPLRGWIAGLIAGAAGAVVLGWIMVRIGAALPHLDAALTSYSLVASWWGARKHVANWWLWIAVDLIYVGEYLYKDLRLTALLYTLLVGLAVLGLRDWSRAPLATQAAD